MVELSVTNRGNIASDLYDFSKTLDNDPGKHKLKALLGTGASALGVMYLVSSKAKAPFKSTSPSLVTTLLSSTVPAAIYYAVQNRDRLGRAALGTGTAIAAGAKLSQYHDLPIDSMSSAEQNAAIAKGSLGVAATAIPALYTLHHLQAARDIEKLQKLKADTNMSPIDKAIEINRIKTKKDMLTRYPALAGVPGASFARKIYNKMHPPEPVVSQSDAIEYNLLPENKLKELASSQQ